MPTPLSYLNPAQLSRFIRVLRRDGPRYAILRAWDIMRAGQGDAVTQAEVPVPTGPYSSHVEALWSKEPDLVMTRRIVRDRFSVSLGVSPLVSVIIPVYNEFQYSLRCLWSVLCAGDVSRLEVIIADDGSSDETEAFFSSLPGLRYIRHPENLGFLRSCNRAAGFARAPLLYFLNNDTAVLPGWIDRIVETFEAYPEAGLVGSKLIYPDGVLQEAGGFIWSDGGGANAGRGGDPAEPGYNFLRDVDYVSGAGMAVRRRAWDLLGGFDTRYAPAYCEDSDLAMSLRQHGWRVLYQPRSEVVHFEGISSGTDVTQGVKSYQVVNQKQLRAKWAYALADHAPDHQLDPRALVRPRRPRLCVIDATVPTPDKDAGSVTALWYLRILRDLGYDITYLPENLYLNGDYGRALQALGVEVLHSPYVQSVEEYLRAYGSAFDAFLLYRVDSGGRFNPLIRSLFPETPVIFDTVDLHYLRLERQAGQPGAEASLAAQAQAVKKRELALIGSTAATIVLSEQERHILAQEGLEGPVSVIPLVLEGRRDVPGRSGRKGIAFVGGYSHTPNVDAVLWFCREIWPLLHASMPDLTFHVVGSNPPPEILEIDAEGVVVHGFVADLDGFLDQRIATVAPLQYGAGIKGKIGSSLAAGVPCVATPMAAEGMGLAAGRELLVAETARAFAAEVETLCRDEGLWERLSAAGLDFVERTYAPAVIGERLLQLLAKVGVVPFSGVCPLTGRSETRRFLEAGLSDSLSAGADGAWSSERVLARALMERVAPGARHMGAVPMGAGAIATLGRLPALSRGLQERGLRAGPGQAELLAMRLELSEAAGAQLLEALEATGAAETLVALTEPATKGPDYDPQMQIASLVQAIDKTQEWELKTNAMPSPEANLTKVKLLEIKRRETKVGR